MIRQILLVSCLLSVVGLPAIAADTRVALPQLTAAQIVEKNVAARGGLQAWRAVKTLTFSGEMEAGAKQNPTLPFTMKMKRPRKSRLEIKFQGDTAVQAYDGTNGWKLRPFLGRREVEPYTPDEARAALEWQDLDGPLIDYAAKGNKVQLDGTEAVEGHPCYRLQLTLANGQVRHVWIDAQTFLELKMEGSPRRMDGRMRTVATYMRDYKSEGGLVIPHVLETSVEAGKKTHKMIIQAVAANAALDDSLFSRPAVLVAASPLK